jgi:hypothetical protein
MKFAGKGLVVEPRDFVGDLERHKIVRQFAVIGSVREYFVSFTGRGPSPDSRLGHAKRATDAPERAFCI